MSIFRPFKALRPTEDKVLQVASKPYDVLNAAEARAEAKGNPYSFYRVIKPEIDLPDDIDQYSPAVYQKGKENFERLVSDGIMKQDEQESFYIYQLDMGDHTQTGLVGCTAIDDYFNNVIKKHELTRPDKEEDRKNHTRVSRVHYEPVFLSYRNKPTIDQWVEAAKDGAPVYDFVADDDIRHRLWVLSDQNGVNQIAEYFAENVESIYIADGHHRTAANSLVGREIRDKRNGKMGDGHRDNYFMSVLFPDNQMKVLDYNRVVKDLNGLSDAAFLEALGEKFELEKKDSAYRPESEHTIGMYMNSQWYKLMPKSGTFDNEDHVGRMDVTILSKNVLEPLLNIVDLRKDKRIEFVGGMRGLGELERRVDNGEMKAAFAMFPISMQQVITLSDNDLIMPPKVTWFEPKLRSGLFVHKL